MESTSNCECECGKSCNVVEYLDYEKCECRKRLIDKLVEEFSENIKGSFFFYIFNLHFLKQKVYSHQVLMYLNVPGIPVKNPLQSCQIIGENWMCHFRGDLWQLFDWETLLINKNDKNSRHININMMII